MPEDLSPFCPAVEHGAAWRDRPEKAPLQDIGAPAATSPPSPFGTRQTCKALQRDQAQTWMLLIFTPWWLPVCCLCSEVVASVTDTS